MALNGEALAALIITKLTANGFLPESEHAKIVPLVEGIASAVVEHVKANGEVDITSGSSTAKWPIS